MATGEDTFYSLWNRYGFTNSPINGNNKLWASPLYFAASGVFVGSLYSVGYAGDFWSSVSFNQNDVGNGYFFTSGSIGPSIGDYRGNGFSVRCVARPVADSYHNESGPV